MNHLDRLTAGLVDGNLDDELIYSKNADKVKTVGHPEPCFCKKNKVREILVIQRENNPTTGPENTPTFVSLINNNYSQQKLILK